MSAEISLRAKEPGAVLKRAMSDSPAIGSRPLLYTIKLGLKVFSMITGRRAKPLRNKNKA